MKLTLKNLIEQAGGTNHVAKVFGLTSSAVSQWLKKGTLPDSEVLEKTHYSKKLIELTGIEADEWEVREIGRPSRKR